MFSYSMHLSFQDSGPFCWRERKSDKYDIQIKGRCTQTIIVNYVPSTIMLPRVCKNRSEISSLQNPGDETFCLRIDEPRGKYSYSLVSNNGAVWNNRAGRKLGNFSIIVQTGIVVKGAKVANKYRAY